MVVDIVWFGERLGNGSECSTDLGLGFAYAEDLGSTAWAFTLSCGATILHRYCPGIPDIHLFPTLHTIGLHLTLLDLRISSRA
jgi:hypothetical protein